MRKDHLTAQNKRSRKSREMQTLFQSIKVVSKGLFQSEFSPDTVYC